jgi:peroxiredoxin
LISRHGPLGLLSLAIKLCTGKYFGNERTTFIVDAEGKVAEVLRKVKRAEHDALVLSALAEASP